MDKGSGKKRRRRKTQPGSVNVRDVAKEAGVSVASVSRVVNMPEKVGAEVRSRVEAAIRKLHYIPDGAGRALITRRTRLIGAIIPHISHSVYADFMEALQGRLNTAGYNLIIALVGYDREEEHKTILQVLSGGAEALMLAGEQRDETIYELLQARNVPYVLNSVFHPESPHPCVGYDNRGMARQIARHLLDLGHRRIATITGPIVYIDRMKERVEGIRDEMSARGLELRESWILQRNFALAEAREAFRQLMSAPERPSAVIGSNDVMAHGAILEAKTMGLRVPEDVSVTGFDDTEWAAQMSPSLTTVHVPMRAMGTRIGDYLLGRLDGRDMPHATKIEANLVLRESTGPYRKK